MKNNFLFFVWFLMTAFGCGSPGGHRAPVEQSGVTVRNTKTLPAEAGEAGETVPVMKITEWDLELKTEHMERARRHMESLIKQYEAMITRENESTFGNRKQIEWEVRVPSDKAEAFVEDIRRAEEWEVVRSNLNVRDVTDSYMDMQTRLRNLRKLEERYTEMLKTAKTTADMITVEKELNRIRTQIERLEGQMARMKNRVDYTRVHIFLHEDIMAMPSFFARLKTAFTDGWRLFQELVLLVARLWLVGLTVFLLVLWWRWHKRRQAAKAGMADHSHPHSGSSST
ncbi:MAG: DUF4349 domain-containing protein [Chlorobi bacterium]|nr:DUF4349 domain-containing protein [Chlorobiota bacterium]